MTPIEIMVESARLIRVIAAMAQEQKAELIEAMDRPTIDWVVDLLVKASDIAAKAAPFGFPRLAAIEHVGDVPAVNIGNRVVFELKIGAPRYASKLVEASASSMEQSSIAPETAATRRRET